MKPKAGPKVSLDFKKIDDNNFIGFAIATKTAIAASTWYTHPKIAITVIDPQITDLQDIVTKIADGNKGPANTKTRDIKRNALQVSLVANAKDIETSAWIKAAGDVNVAEQLILSLAYEVAGKATHKARTFEVVETGPGWVHVRTVRSADKPEMVHWEYGITPKKEVPPTETIKHTFINVDLIITDLASSCIVGIHKSGEELAGKPKKYQHPTVSHLTGEQLDWSDWLYVVIP